MINNIVQADKNDLNHFRFTLKHVLNLFIQLSSDFVRFLLFLSDTNHFAELTVGRNSAFSISSLHITQVAS